MAEWNSGQVILGEYTIEKELGRGGMGRVWLVKSNSTGRRFAVKQTLLKDEKHRKAFLTELQTWIDLPEHPNIVTCRFFKTVGDEIVIFADYIEGGSLADWIAEGKLTSLEQIIDIAIQFAWGLHAIHERGLIHQDVKPGNVLMTPDGVPMVTDFGLARARLRAANGVFVSQVLQPGPQSVQVSSGGMTPAYASPEQFAGKPLSRKTDIWSWGVSVLDMLAGDVTCRFGGHLALSVLEAMTQDGDMPGFLKASDSIVDVLRSCFHSDESARWPDMRQPALKLSSCYQAYTSRAYPRSEPELLRQNSTRLFVRKDYFGDGWASGDEWLFIARTLEERGRPSIDWIPLPEQDSRSGNAISDLGKYEEALTRLRRLLASGMPEIAAHLCRLCLEKSHIHGELNDVDGELSAYDQCIEYAQVLQKQPEAREFSELTMAQAFNLKARLVKRRGSVHDAILLYAESLRHWKLVLVSNGGDSNAESSYAVTLRNAAIANRIVGNLAEALRLYDEAVSVFTRLAEQNKGLFHSGDSMQLQTTLRFKGVALRNGGHTSQALQCYSQSMEILDAMAGTRTDSEYYEERARLLRDKACAVSLDEAVGLCHEAMRIYRNLLDKYSSEHLLSELAQTSANCSAFLCQLDRPEEALCSADESLRAWGELVNNQGKLEYTLDYYTSRLHRVLVLHALGKSTTVYVEAQSLSQDLQLAIQATNDGQLRMLFSLGVKNGYW